MSGQHRHFRLGIASLAALLTGCAVGPDFKRPAPPPVERFTANPLPAETTAADIKGGEAQQLIAGRDLPAEWWTLFRSPALDTLMQQAIKANPDLQSAEAALRVAEENVKAQVGA